MLNVATMIIPGIPGGGGGGLGGNSTAGMSDQEAAMVKAVSPYALGAIQCDADRIGRCNLRWRAALPRPSYREGWGSL